MTRTILSSLAVAAVLATTAGGLSQGRAEDFQVWQKNLGSPSSKKSGRSREPGALAGKPRKPRKAWPSKIQLPSLVKERR
jgi:hypothetical protein